MELHQIEIDLQQQDFQYRLRAIAALKGYPPEVAIPLLSRHTQDPEFLVRTFVARELGNQLTSESFATLLQLAKFDNTPNVRAEAANSISMFGKISASHLVQIFTIDDHWLVRRSIMTALMDLECHTELFEICMLALTGEDEPLREAAVNALGTLAQSPHHTASLSKLLSLKDDESPRLRAGVVLALRYFDEPEAKAAILQLRQDRDRRVVGATLEDLLP